MAKEKEARREIYHILTGYIWLIALLINKTNFSEYNLIYSSCFFFPLSLSYPTLEFTISSASPLLIFSSLSAPHRNFLIRMSMQSISNLIRLTAAACEKSPSLPQLYFIFFKYTYYTCSRFPSIEATETKRFFAFFVSVKNKYLLQQRVRIFFHPNISPIKKQFALLVFVIS